MLQPRENVTGKRKSAGSRLDSGNKCTAGQVFQKALTKRAVLARSAAKCITKTTTILSFYTPKESNAHYYFLLI